MDLEQQIKLTKKQLNSLNRARSHVSQLTAKCKKLQVQLQQKVEKEFEEYEDIKHRNEQAIRNLFRLPDEEEQ